MQNALKMTEYPVENTPVPNECIAQTKEFSAREERVNLNRGTRSS